MKQHQDTSFGAVNIPYCNCQTQTQFSVLLNNTFASDTPNARDVLIEQDDSTNMISFYSKHICRVQPTEVFISDVLVNDAFVMLMPASIITPSYGAAVVFQIANRSHCFQRRLVTPNETKFIYLQYPRFVNFMYFIFPAYFRMVNYGIQGFPKDLISAIKNIFTTILKQQLFNS